MNILQDPAGYDHNSVLYTAVVMATVEPMLQALPKKILQEINIYGCSDGNSSRTYYILQDP